MWPTFPLKPPPLHRQHQRSLSALQNLRGCIPKNNGGRKHSRRTFPISCRLPGLATGMRLCDTDARRVEGGGGGGGGGVAAPALRCLKSAVMQSFESDGAGRKGLSLLQ